MAPVVLGYDWVERQADAPAGDRFAAVSVPSRHQRMPVVMGKSTTVSTRSTCPSVPVPEGRARSGCGAWSPAEQVAVRSCHAPPAAPAQLAEPVEALPERN